MLVHAGPILHRVGTGNAVIGAVGPDQCDFVADKVGERDVFFRVAIVVERMHPGIGILHANDAIQLAAKALGDLVKPVFPAPDIGEHGDLVVFLQDDTQKIGATPMQPVLFDFCHAHTRLSHG